MNKIICGVLVLILLAACSSGPATIDASSRETLRTSSEKVRTGLPPTDGQAFTEAMQVIAMKEIADAVETDGLLGAVAAAKTTDATTTFDRLAATVQGKTGAEVIKIAADIQSERKKRQIAAVSSDIATLETEIAAATAAADQSAAVLKAIGIAGAKFYWNEEGFLPEPVIQFTITNNGATAIKRGYFHGILETPGRSVPWVDEDFNYDFAGGIEPGESQDLQLAPGSYGKWGNQDIRKRDDMVLTVTVVDFEGPDGTRQLGEVADLSAKQKKLDDLQSKLSELR